MHADNFDRAQNFYCDASKNIVINLFCKFLNESFCFSSPFCIRIETKSSVTKWQISCLQYPRSCWCRATLFSRIFREPAFSIRNSTCNVYLADGTVSMFATRCDWHSGVLGLQTKQRISVTKSEIQRLAATRKRWWVAMQSGADSCNVSTDAPVRRSASRRGVTAQDFVLFIATSMKTSNPTYRFLWAHCRIQASRERKMFLRLTRKGFMQLIEFHKGTNNIWTLFYGYRNGIGPDGGTRRKSVSFYLRSSRILIETVYPADWVSICQCSNTNNYVAQSLIVT
jgi:hypothetical protein